MAIRYKTDVLKLLKEAGYNTTVLRREKIMGEATIQKLRSGELVSWHNINIVCGLLNCQPGSLVEYVPEVEKR